MVFFSGNLHYLGYAHLYIDGNGHKLVLKTNRNILFNQSYEVQIMPLVIYCLGGRHTDARMQKHITIRTKVILVNQARAWFKNCVCFKLI